MLKFRNIVFFMSSLGEFFAANLTAPEAKRVHVEPVILPDNNSLTEHDESTDAVFGGTDSNTTIGVDDHSQGFSSNENSTLHDKEISTTTEEESTLSADSVEQQVADILQIIPEIGVRAFEGVSQKIIDAAVREFAWAELGHRYESSPDVFLKDLQYINDDACYQVMMLVFGTKYGFTFDPEYLPEHHEAIQSIFKTKRNIANIYDQLPI